MDSPELQEQVQEILRSVDEEVEAAREAKCTEATLELPVFFDLPRVSYESAQTQVYYYVVRALEERGYRLTLQRGARTSDPSYLFFSWGHQEKNTDRQMQQYLERFVVRKTTAPKPHFQLQDLQNNHYKKQNIKPKMVRPG